MTVRRFFQWALAAPVVFPVVVIAIVALVWGVGDLEARPLGGALEVSAFVLAGSLFFGGVQYLVFAGVVLWWLRRQPGDVRARWIWLAPLVYLPFLTVGLSLFFLAEAGLGGLSPAGDLLAPLTFFGVVALVLGYAYVAVAYLLLLAARRAGWVRRTGPAAGAPGGPAAASDHALR